MSYHVFKKIVLFFLDSSLQLAYVYTTHNILHITCSNTCARTCTCARAHTHTKNLYIKNGASRTMLVLVMYFSPWQGRCPTVDAQWLNKNFLYSLKIFTSFWLKDYLKFLKLKFSYRYYLKNNWKLNIFFFLISASVKIGFPKKATLYEE